MKIIGILKVSYFSQVKVAKISIQAHDGHFLE
jgi:hypothetical protein